jgi:hypothetical protein
MREQNLDPPDAARLVRGAAAGHRQVWRGLEDQYAWLLRAGAPSTSASVTRRPARTVVSAGLPLAAERAS